MVILGIDPGLATVGWGVIRSDGSRHKALAYGSVVTPAHTATEKRLTSIYSQLEAIIKKYTPDAMAVEELFFNTNITTGIRVAEARGVILLCAERMGVKIYEYTPLQVKQSVVGYGRAEKKQVIAMVTALLSLQEPPKPDDTADALAIAVCHAHTGISRISAYFNK
ncbi:MAG: crossover junction endodeoxyribonuclease RuvC [Clostridia bacterium]|nr:crossover junction endodeoxyribonuclease RuvC [Clostridia bacterium]